ncbi:hypothetical protein FPV67DRAFT_1673659 [Lyophyllum atratum]|nr:hypothetical protein FPV67DRAFT_1673659 [Lyophyllum atratum]
MTHQFPLMLLKIVAADWADAKFNLIEAKAIYTQGTPDLVQTQPGKKSSSTGAIVGGVVGGLAVVIIAGLIAFFMYRRKQRLRQPSATANHGYGDTSGHARNISDLSRKSNGIGLGYQTQDRSFATSPSSQPPMSATSGTMHTHTSSVNSLSYFGSANHSVAPYSSPSPPPVARTLSPSPPPHHMRMNREDIIVPFTLAPSPQAVSRQGSHSNLTDRKRADGAIIPVYDSPNSLPTLNNRSGESSGESNVPSRMRRNPPAYSAVDESSQVARSRPAHTKKGSSDTQHSLDSNTSGATTVRHGSASPGGGSVAAIDDVIGQMGFTQGGEESVSGSGGTLGTGQSRQSPRNPGFRPVLGNPDA